MLALEGIDGSLLAQVNVEDLSPQVRRKIVENGTDAVLGFDREFRTEVAEYVSELSAGATSFANLQIGPILQGLFDLLRKWQIECPSDLV
ncbi:MAG: hypothetical protein ACYSUR_13555, partial [Planctomycetota bacterium]